MLYGIRRISHQRMTFATEIGGGGGENIQPTAFPMIFMATSIGRSAQRLTPGQHELNQSLDRRGIVVSFPDQC